MLLQRWSYLQHLSANSADNLQENCKQISSDAEPESRRLDLREPSYDWDRFAMPRETRPHDGARSRASKRGATGDCASWSIPVEDGAYATVPAWRSRSSWLQLLREMLESVDGMRLWKGRVNIDTVMMVARVDAETADGTSGRGVMTSHETVAKRVGMSSRQVGTARRVIEKLGLAVTIIRGRHLSPQERSKARAAHGRYQEAAASVRALTMPAGAVQARTGAPGVSEHHSAASSVDTFHLPGTGSVNEFSYLSEKSPMRAGARKKAAPRPKPRKKSYPKPERQPRAVEMQRFAWDILQRFLLAEGTRPQEGALVTPGALRGRKHIGNLMRVLERNRITPARYTVKSLSEALDTLIAAGKLPPARYDELRDPFANFAWRLGKLTQLTEGETTLERINRENAERAQRRAEQARQAAALTETDQAAADAAAATFFAQSHLTRRPKPQARRTDITALVTTIIGAGAQLQTAPTAVQLLAGNITTMHRALVNAGYQLHTADNALEWTGPSQPIRIALHRAGADVTAQLLATTPYDSPTTITAALAAFAETQKEKR